MSKSEHDRKTGGHEEPSLSSYAQERLEYLEKQNTEAKKGLHKAKRIKRIGLGLAASSLAVVGAIETHHLDSLASHDHIAGAIEGGLMGGGVQQMLRGSLDARLRRKQLEKTANYASLLFIPNEASGREYANIYGTGPKPAASEWIIENVSKPYRDDLVEGIGQYGSAEQRAQLPLLRPEDSDK